MRSFGESSAAEESDLEKLRLRGADSFLGVVAGVVPCGSGPLVVSEFHLRCLFAGSLLPTGA